MYTIFAWYIICHRKTQQISSKRVQTNKQTIVVSHISDLLKRNVVNSVLAHLLLTLDRNIVITYTESSLTFLNSVTLPGGKNYTPYDIKDKKFQS